MFLFVPSFNCTFSCKRIWEKPSLRFLFSCASCVFQLAGILLDTKNLDASSQSSMTRDAEAVQLLSVGSAQNCRNGLYDQCMPQKFSFTISLCDYQHILCLRNINIAYFPGFVSYQWCEFKRSVHFWMPCSKVMESLLLMVSFLFFHLENFMYNLSCSSNILIIILFSWIFCIDFIATCMTL